RDDDHRDARLALRAAESEAARLLRGGAAPVVVTAPPADRDGGDDTAAVYEAGDVVVVSAPVDGMETPLQQVAEAAPDSQILVVTGDPDDGGGGGGSELSPAERRAQRLRRAVRTVADAHADGIAVVGAFHLPAVDGYEWHRGFDARLGLFDRDRNPLPAVDELP
ncbi:MAG: hypothetical protein ACRDZN_09850, partial [Acidimicrobiales bacterium]